MTKNDRCLSDEGLRRRIRLEMQRLRHGVPRPPGGIDALLAYGGTWQALLDILRPDHLSHLKGMDLIRLAPDGGELNHYVPPEEIRRIVEAIGGRKSFDDQDAPVSTAPSPKGGRPPAEWTEELWFACFKHILDEGLFNRKAELRSFMADWLASKNIHPSESTLKAKAGEFWSRAGLDENP